MKLVFVLSLFISLPLFAIDCQQRAQQELFALIKHDAKGILQQQYAITTLKLAILGRNKKHTQTLEQYLQTTEKNIHLQGQAEITQLNNLYQRYGINNDYQKVIESMKTSLYWKKQSRFYNQDISAFILLANTKHPQGLLNQTDAAIAWFAQKVSKNQRRSKSSSYNMTNISTQVAFLNGKIKGFTKLDTTTLNKKLNALKQKVEIQLTKAINNFSQTFKQQCAHYFKTLCTNKKIRNNLFAQMLFQFKEQLPLIKTPLLKRHLNKILQRQNLTFTSPTPPKKYKKYFYQPVTIPQIKRSFIYKDLETFKQRFNGKDDQKLIHAYHQHFMPSRYGILNKSTQELSIFGINNKLLLKIRVNIKAMTDRHPPGIGAGIFYLDTHKRGKTLTLQSQRKKTSTVDMQTVQVECSPSGICQSTQSTELDKIYRYLGPNDPLYILPEEDGNTFVFKNGILNFTTLVRRKKYSVYDYSPRNTKPHPIIAVIKNPKYNTPDAQKFITTLQTEKAKLMKMYNLDNDEYNDLMKLAFGILGNESKFGTSKRYYIKETLPFVVSLAKGNWFDTSKNSRGPTQIKRVPKLIAKKYNVTKDNLTDASNAAVATLGFLAESLQELKGKERIAKKHGLVINSLNRMEYVHYIYMGRAKEITKGTATPQKNIYYRQIRQYADDLLIIEQ